jgi:hypothetical protein
VWRFDENGRRKLSLRRLHVLIHHLPADSATHIELTGDGWTLEHYLLAHIFQANAGIPHPALPKTSESEDPIRQKKIEEFKERARIRAEKIANDEIT